MASYIINGTDSGPRTRNVRAFVDLHSYGQLCECFVFIFSMGRPLDFCVGAWNGLV